MAELGSPDGARLAVETEQRGAALTLRLAGELDLTTADALHSAVAPALEAGVERVVLDVSELRFVDSSGIATWLRWAADVGALELRDPTPLLRALIGSMGLSETLRVVS